MSSTNLASKAVIPADLFAVYRDAIHQSPLHAGPARTDAKPDWRHELT